MALATFTRPHRLGEPLEPQLAALIRGFRKLRQSLAWKRLAPVEWSYRIHVTYGPNGAHPHLHAVLMLGPEWENVGLPSSVLEGALRSAWDGSVRARLVGSLREVLYPWDDGPLDGAWADEVMDPDRWADFDWDAPAFPGEEVTWSDVAVEPGEVPEWWDPELSLRGWRRGLSPWEVASLAAAGHKRAYHWWIELHHASKRHRLSQCSPGVNAKHRLRVQAEKREFALRCLVAARLWNLAQFRARRKGGPCMERALWVGRRRGVEAMARYLEAELNYPVAVVRPRGSPAPVLTCPLSESDYGGS